MRGYKREFIELALELGVLQFGEFTLKSGRVSPYFFSAGLFNTGYAAAKLGRFYAAAIIESEIRFDMLFGPAYKGIPLATLAASSLAEQHDIDVPYSFNRKEVKAHGEGGSIVGAPLSGRVLPERRSARPTGLYRPPGPRPPGWSFCSTGRNAATDLILPSRNSKNRWIFRS